MPPSPLELRTNFLVRTQNADGGWGYFARKESWTEPTAYAVIALTNSHPELARRGLEALEKRQLPSGAWAANAQVAEPHWSTTLVLLAQQALGRRQESYRRGIQWLLGFQGVEANILVRFLRGLRREPLVDQDETLHGWPWREGNASWVEPTALSMLCLQRDGGETARARIASGEKMLLDRRCEDHGWNYGNRRVYGVPMESFPETTGVALMALQGRPGVEKSIERARTYLAAPAKGVARTWLHLALVAHGQSRPINLAEELGAGAGIVLAALEVVAAEPTLHRHFLREAKWPTS